MYTAALPDLFARSVLCQVTSSVFVFSTSQPAGGKTGCSKPSKMGTEEGTSINTEAVMVSFSGLLSTTPFGLFVKNLSTCAPLLQVMGASVIVVSFRKAIPRGKSAFRLN